MNCSNCGAAMDLLSERGYFYCRYCGSFQIPDTTADEGAAITGPAAPPTACPLCTTELSSALLDGHTVLACGHCKGLLMPRRTFGLVVTARRARETRTTVPSAVRPFDVPRRLACPVCRGPMLTHPYYGPGNVIIDTCEPCDLVWLDPGELTRIAEAPGNDRR